LSARRLAFFLGKGGVGKTTLAAAAAACLARRGRRVLVASLDPAHNLGDVLGRPLSNAPAPVAARLDGLEVDVAAWAARYLEESRAEIKASYAYTMSLNLDSLFDVLRHAPGTEEYAVLWAIEHIQREHGAAYDHILLDTPPTALALRFLAMPSLSLIWVQALARLREQILIRRQTVLKVNPEASVIRGATDPREDRVRGKLSAIQQRLQRLQGLFARESHLALVLNPDALSLAEALRIQAELARLGLRVHGLCLNKAGAEAPPPALAERFPGVPVFRTALQGAGPAGLAGLDVSRLAAHLEAG